MCELGFVELLATRRALPWYINLKFEFAEQEVAQLHVDLDDGAAGLFRDRRAAGEAAAHRLNYKGERDLRRSACRQCK